jgi:hypothetical protein
MDYIHQKLGDASGHEVLLKISIPVPIFRDLFTDQDSNSLMLKDVTDVIGQGGPRVGSYYFQVRLGSVASHVIKARNLRMVWLTEDFVSGYSYNVSVRTGLPDHTKQTKFRNQR